MQQVACTIDQAEITYLIQVPLLSQCGDAFQKCQYIQHHELQYDLKLKLKCYQCDETNKHWQN